MAALTGSLHYCPLHQWYNQLIRELVQLRLSVTGFPQRRTGFEPCSSHVGSVVDRAALGQVSSEYFSFPCHSFIPLIAPQSSPSIIQGWYNRPINDRSNSGPGSTPAHPQIKNFELVRKPPIFSCCELLLIEGSIRGGTVWEPRLNGMSDVGSRHQATASDDCNQVTDLVYLVVFCEVCRTVALDRDK
jgi:hypothetical protein